MRFTRYTGGLVKPSHISYSGGYSSYYSFSRMGDVLSYRKGTTAFSKPASDLRCKRVTLKTTYSLHKDLSYYSVCGYNLVNAYKDPDPSMFFNAAVVVDSAELY